MIQLKLTASHFEELIKKGIPLDLLFLLKAKDMGEIISSGPKIENLKQTAIRKGLCEETGGLTEEGKQLLAFLSSTEESPKLPRRKKEKTPAIEDDDFIKWWKTYPASDTFDYKGRKFKGTRALRVKKNDCEAKLNKIITSGEYKIDELIMALRLEISQKAENSVKTGQNKMSYFQNSLTYLNQGTYDAYVELVRAGHKPEEDTKTLTTNETFI